MNVRTYPPSGTKRSKSEVNAFIIDGTIDESLRIDLLSFIPVLGISSGRPCINNHFGLHCPLLPEERFFIISDIVHSAVVEVLKMSQFLLQAYNHVLKSCSSTKYKTHINMHGIQLGTYQDNSLDVVSCQGKIQGLLDPEGSNEHQPDHHSLLFF
ncbi:hypothetical protein V6N11_042681 [Hibiscus sabdariffa]|uniref:Uncharacterized protein n=1 Tax=Hibiscus sabdariffa TaxID=183260 RepID=A0ABR2QX25_9ROSI